MSRRIVFAVLLIIAAACGSKEPAPGAPTAPKATITELPSPAGNDALAPYLASTTDGRVLMSWLEPAGGKQHALKFASHANGKWSEARTITAREDFFVNWADFPSIVADERGTLFAHWLQKSGPGTYSYDVHVTSSSDGGATWKPSRVLNTDNKQAEHGFVSMVPRPGGGVGVVWLDGREMPAEGHDGGHGGHGEGAMTIRYANLDAELATSDETVLDDRVCECCTTGMTMTASGPVAAYRDRSPEEIRDIGFAKLTGGKWSAPALVHPDNWKINGCPVNGPQLDARGNEVVVAWFTSGGGAARVNAAFSSDGGATWGKPVRVDNGKPVGRVDVQLLADGQALVTWIESGKDNASVLTRRVARDGKTAEPITISSTTAARGSGFPRTTMVGQEVWFSWTEPGKPRKVHVAKMTP